MEKQATTTISVRDLSILQDWKNAKPEATTGAFSTIATRNGCNKKDVENVIKKYASHLPKEKRIS